MVGYWPARGLYTLLTDPDLVGHNMLRNLCKGVVASLCNHISVVWYDAWPASRRWVQSSSELLRCLWWKCTTSAECKTNRLAVLTVKSGLDPHMITKLEDGLKLWYVLWLCLPYAYGVPYLLLTVKIRQPSHEFTFGVGMSFIPYPLVLTPVV
jgi:hypothetical protein